jgi:two-component system, OmpR family, phosphate regulon sensor histidine kinase PhoR
MPRRLGVRPRTLTGRLLLWHAVAVLGVLLVSGVVLDRVLERSFVQQLTSSLISDARGLQQSLPTTADLESEVRRIGSAMGVRITIIRTDGVVLADSEHDPATMQNHRDRPEVREALSGRIGESSRRSHTIGIRFRYVALPPLGGRIVRVALPLTDVAARVGSVRVVLAVGFGLAALAGLLALGLIARRSSRPLREITGAVQRVGANEPGVEVPERGTRELVLLASTVNRMRAEIESRIRSVEEERTARDVILATLEEGVVLFDASGAAVYSNDRAGWLLGDVPREAGALRPSTLASLVRHPQAVARSLEVEVGAPARSLLATAVPLGDDGRLLLVLRDVTEAKTLEAVRRDFVANASHELKTPAASIRALAETIGHAAADDPEALRRFAGQLELEALRLSRIIGDLLDLSRLEGGMTDREPVRLDLLIAEETARAGPTASRRDLALAVDAARAVTVSGSSRDLALLVRNLIENALHYTKPGGRVDVSVAAEGDRALLMVTDTGIGIPARDQRRIFERFFRVDRARSRETGGTGLGLSIVKHVAENHGGSVQVRSRLGEGSTFTVRLPLEDTAPPAAPREPASVSSVR